MDEYKIIIKLQLALRDKRYEYYRNKLLKLE